MSIPILLVPSPLLGPATWAPVAALLRQAGHEVSTVSFPPDLWSPDDVLTALLDAVPADRQSLLVPHSNAGLYVPLVAARRPVAAAVFVDAGVPPDGGDVPLAPPDFHATLAGLADEDGMLPPWSRWWPNTASLFPDDDTRVAVEAEQPRLPMSYFRATLTVGRGWTALPCAYLAFGDTYAADREAARERGWPVLTLAGGHLHALHDPVAVAGGIATLLTRLDGS